MPHGERILVAACKPPAVPDLARVMTKEPVPRGLQRVYSCGDSSPDANDGLTGRVA
ncbi:MAG TPA: hypothetical protein PLB41_11990 [Rubrivivax sp.]|nr:hypothetical protein [Rubrivivax sp.]